MNAVSTAYRKPCHEGKAPSRLQCKYSLTATGMFLLDGIIKWVLRMFSILVVFFISIFSVSAISISSISETIFSQYISDT